MAQSNFQISNSREVMRVRVKMMNDCLPQLRIPPRLRTYENVVHDAACGLVTNQEKGRAELIAIGQQWSARKRSDAKVVLRLNCIFFLLVQPINNQRLRNFFKASFDIKKY